MWQPDPTSLRLFVAICEEGSIARASEREAIAAAAVSKRITDMEQSLGTPLLSRRARGVSPTAAGEVLLRHARHLMHSVEVLQADLSEFSTGVRGLVRVMANVSSIVEFVPDLIASFLQSNEKIGVVLDERVSTEIVRGVADGIADIGICRDFVGGTEVQMLPFRDDHFGVVVHKDHPLSGMSILAFPDTFKYEQIGLSVNAALNSLMKRVASEHDRPLRYRANVSTFDAALRLIQLNLGLAVLPIEAVTRYRQTYDICTIPLSDDWATRQFVICVQHVDKLSVAARRFFDHLMSSDSGCSHPPNLPLQGLPVLPLPPVP
ncbi:MULTISPECIES: LysR substrate-binding domain-containing protein [Paraburkholderia]|uniref:LysR family transcriptional regulator n=1 Tax=Paraburkholderia podalyriae TaxID=1938811 RepID=A0ABR7PU59_9BURK|nr:LysR substrate-binding domain-containing protein [Paraburkholderia podalyriae]MBC8749819.1 LysR family transcriptional regulator [Paraburkholderia podalyriae]